MIIWSFNDVSATYILHPDNGASDHITSDSDSFQEVDSEKSSRTLTVANGKTLPIIHTWSYSFLLQNKSVRLNDILLSPTIKKNLLSVSRLCANNSISLCFDKSNVYSKDLHTNDPEVVIGEVKGGLYQINLDTSALASEANSCNSSDLQTWHCRLGHICESTTWKVVASHGLPASNKSFICKSCILSKHHRLPYKSMDLIYVDVWGLALCVSISGDRFYLLFVDDCTHFNWIFPLKAKFDVKQMFIDFKIRIENTLDRKIKSLQLDNGGEFIALGSFLKHHGIVHQRSCPSAHQQMGAVEQCHQHIVDSDLAMLNHAGLPLSF